MGNKTTKTANLLLSALLSAGAVLLFAGRVEAQTPVREAQLPVRGAQPAARESSHDKVVAELDEPHHKLLLENEYIRVIDGHVPGHDTTLTHIHAANSVVVWLSKSTFGIQNVGGKPALTDVNQGDAVYRAYGDKPVTHIVWNNDMAMFHFMVVELKRRGPAGEATKQRPDSDSSAILAQPSVQFQWQQPLVRAYYLNIAKGTQCILPKSNYAYLLIAISGTVTTVSSGRDRVPSGHTRVSSGRTRVSADRTRSLHANDFAFFPPRKGIEINGGKDENVHCVLLEIK